MWYNLFTELEKKYMIFKNKQKVEHYKKKLDLCD